MLGLDMSIKSSQECSKVLGIALGEGDANSMRRMFNEEGMSQDWHQFEQLKLPSKSQPVSTLASKRKKKDDECLSFDPEKELDISDLLKHSKKPTASTRKKVPPGVSNEEFLRMLLEKNYHFPLSR